MPRQPYTSLVKSDAPTNIDVSTAILGQRPELEKLVGDSLISWPNVEAEMALYLGELLHSRTPATLAVFQTLRRFSLQRDTILAAGEMELTPADLELLEAVLDVHKSVETGRTALAHGHFGISSNVPDGLLWMKTTDYVDIRMALDRQGPKDDTVKRLLSRVWVYRKDDLTKILEDIKEQSHGWFNMTRYQRMIGKARTDLYAEICARPRIKAALDRRKNANAATSPNTSSKPPISRLY